MVSGHGQDLRRQLLANVLSHRFALDLGRQVIAPLGGGLVDRALKEIQGIVDLPFDLLLPEPERVSLFHMYA